MTKRGRYQFERHTIVHKFNSHIYKLPINALDKKEQIWTMQQMIKIHATRVGVAHEAHPEPHSQRTNPEFIFMQNRIYHSVHIEETLEKGHCNAKMPLSLKSPNWLREVHAYILKSESWHLIPILIDLELVVITLIKAISPSTETSYIGLTGLPASPGRFWALRKTQHA